MGFRKNEMNKGHVEFGDGIYISGGHLHVKDDLGEYSIPIGRKVRRELVVVDAVEGQYRRTLQIDLLTGFIYYCVDNYTQGGNAYYYDMPSKKIWRERVVQILNHIQKEEFKPSLEEYRVYSQLPCDDWEELLGTLPGWKNMLDHRLDDLLLPHGNVEKVSYSPHPAQVMGDVLSNEPEQIGTERRRKIEAADYEIREALGNNFRIAEKEEQICLCYADMSAGAEFFGRDEEYERFLSAIELVWLLENCRKASEDAAKREALEAQVMRLMKRELKIVEADRLD